MAAPVSYYKLQKCVMCSGNSEIIFRSMFSNPHELNKDWAKLI